MAFTGKLSYMGPAGSLGNRSWKAEQLTDTLDNIKGSGYFNSVTTTLRKNDHILIVGSDGQQNIYVTSESGAATVTTDAFASNNQLENEAVTNNKVAPNADIQYSKMENVSSGQILVGNPGNKAAAVTMGKDATIDHSGQITIADHAVNSKKVSTYAVNDNEAAIEITLVYDLVGGATTNTDKTITHKMTIVGFEVINKADGTPGDTVQLQTGTGADISDVLSVGAVNNSKIYAGSIFTANSVIDAGGTLRMREVDGGGNDSPAVRCIIRGFLTA